MAYKVIILYRLYMPSYFLGTFTEYPYLIEIIKIRFTKNADKILVKYFTGIFCKSLLCVFCHHSF